MRLTPRSKTFPPPGARMCRCHASITATSAVRTATQASGRNGFFQPKYTVMCATVTGKPAREAPTSSKTHEFYAHSLPEVRVGPERQESGPRHQKHGRLLASVARHAREDQSRRVGPNRTAQGRTGESQIQTAEGAGPLSPELTGRITF